MDEKFQLKTPDPPKRKARYQSDPAQQGVLFAGSFSCLSDQADLFPTDGNERSDDDEADDRERDCGDSVPTTDQTHAVDSDAGQVAGEGGLSGGIDLQSHGDGDGEDDAGEPEFCRVCGQDFEPEVSGHRFFCQPCSLSESQDLEDLKNG